MPTQSCSTTGGNWPPGWGLRPGNTVPAARRGWERITKQGDKYLRMLLIHGARSVLAALRDKPDRINCWLRELVARRGYKRAAVALAAKNARIIWVLLTRGEDYRIQAGIQTASA